MLKYTAPSHLIAFNAINPHPHRVQLNGNRSTNADLIECSSDRCQIGRSQIGGRYALMKLMCGGSGES